MSGAAAVAGKGAQALLFAAMLPPPSLVAATLASG